MDAQDFVDKAMSEGQVNTELARLAALSPVDYERERKDAAEKLGLRRLSSTNWSRQGVPSWGLVPKRTRRGQQ
jgi:hypothetical protein